MSLFTEQTGSLCENVSRYYYDCNALLNGVIAEDGVVDAPVVMLPEIAEDAHEGAAEVSLACGGRCRTG
jgi:hypothetical protein